MTIDWRRKFKVYGEALVDLLLEALLLAVWILITYGLAQLVKFTVGEQWPELGDQITSVVLLIVTVIGSLELIISVSVRTYNRIRKEIGND